ncbi:MAG TPA: hypothetical protein VFD92_24995 [Candidatus Binatia bacterium]|nr:hypothetical protein [Candidatus Binatia bacterium]
MTKPARLALGIAAAGVGCAGAAIATAGSPRWLWAWTAGACWVAAAAYAANRPEIFGKRSGRLSRSRAIALLPYLLAFRIACAIMRAWRRTPRVSRVDSDLWVGGRIRASDVPPGTAFVVDLTSEFSAPAAVQGLPGYRSHPVLDGSFPRDETAFLELLEEIAARDGGVLVHCESGRGRAPTAAALVLLARGRARDPQAAIEIVRRGRPWTKLTATDLRFIARIAERLAERDVRRRGVG